MTAHGSCDADKTRILGGLWEAGLALPTQESHQKGCYTWEPLGCDLFIKEVKSFAKWALRRSAEELSPTSLWWVTR